MADFPFDAVVSEFKDDKDALPKALSRQARPKVHSLQVTDSCLIKSICTLFSSQ